MILRSKSYAGWIMRRDGCHRAEKLGLLKPPNEEREGALRQSCCECVGYEIEEMLICHTPRTSSAVHQAKKCFMKSSVGERDSEPTINQATLLKTCCCASRMAPHVTLTAAKRRADSFGR